MAKIISPNPPQKITLTNLYNKEEISFKGKELTDCVEDSDGFRYFEIDEKEDLQIIEEFMKRVKNKGEQR